MVINWKSDESNPHRVHLCMMDTRVCVCVCVLVVIYIYMYVYMYEERIDDSSITHTEGFRRAEALPTGFPAGSNAPPRPNRDKVHPSCTLSRLSHPRRVLYKVSSPAQSSCLAAILSAALFFKLERSQRCRCRKVSASESRWAYRFSCHLRVFVSIIATCKTLTIDLGGIFLNAILRSSRTRRETGSRVDMYTSRSSRIKARISHCNPACQGREGETASPAALRSQNDRTLVYAHSRENKLEERRKFHWPFRWFLAGQRSLGERERQRKKERKRHTPTHARTHT